MEVTKMELLVLGSGAGESYPGSWCTCQNCTYARAHGGKNLRGGSSLLIDQELLIDLPGSALQNASRFGVSLSGVRALLVAHPHTDHFSPNHLWERNYPEEFQQFTEAQLTAKHGAPCVTPLPCLELYGTSFVEEAINAAGDLTLPRKSYHFTYHQIRGGDRFETCGCSITALSARHDRTGYTVNYIVEKEGVSLLYASDTGGYEEDVYRELQKHRFHCVFVEATMGNTPAPELCGHMNLEKAERFLTRLKELGSLAAHCGKRHKARAAAGSAAPYRDPHSGGGGWVYGHCQQ